MQQRLSTVPFGLLNLDAMHFLDGQHSHHLHILASVGSDYPSTAFCSLIGTGKTPGSLAAQLDS